MLGLELVVVIGQMVCGDSESLGAVAFGKLGLVVHLFILRQYIFEWFLNGFIN
jgi:hypothetical protein